MLLLGSQSCVAGECLTRPTLRPGNGSLEATIMEHLSPYPLGPSNLAGPAG